MGVFSSGRMDTQTFKQQFDVFAENWVQKKLAEYPDLVIDEQVLSYITHSGKLIRGGGKRVRPYLCALMYEACGGLQSEQTWQAGLAIELFHTFALIHDDIIDRGVMRRSVPTTHVVVHDILDRAHRLGDIAHVAGGQAMLVGDLVQLWAFEVFQQLPCAESVKQKVFHIFITMINEVIVGEMLDVDFTTRDMVSNSLLYQKTVLKTATYTFVRPLQIGAILAGAGDDTFEFCERFGRALGMAFQIQDDLFDLTLSEDVLHKPVLSDIQEHQHTLFTQYILTKGTEQEKEAFLSYFGKSLGEEEKVRVRELFVSSGAVAYGMGEMNRYFDEAVACLERMSFGGGYLEVFKQSVQFIRQRTS